MGEEALPLTTIDVLSAIILLDIRHITSDFYQIISYAIFIPRKMNIHLSTDKAEWIYSDLTITHFHIT